MAEAVFAGEQIKKLAFVNGAAGFAVAYAPVASLTENFFMGDGPGDGRNGNRKYYQCHYLLAKAEVHKQFAKTSKTLRYFCAATGLLL
jgi:hypothetical protein